MEKKVYQNKKYSGERALFMLSHASLDNIIFFDGESPLKESKDLELTRCTFKWKYPLWYASRVKLDNCVLETTARSGIWYTNDIIINNSTIDAPKTFRRSKDISLTMTNINHADETLWKCQNVKLEMVKAKGDYFMMNSEDIEINHLELDGNYFLDGAKNIVIRDSILHSKDSFWNVENATIINCKIVGEYLGWNSKNLTFINCEISSLQALCYINGLRMVNCKLLDSSLCFEYCENIDATIIDEVASIINPISGIIRVKGVKDLIINENSRDYDKKTQIIINK